MHRHAELPQHLVPHPLHRLRSDNETTPFSRAQRSLVYQRAKGDSDKRPFGTQRDVQAQGYEWINHSLVPTHIASHDFRIPIGASTAAI